MLLDRIVIGTDFSCASLEATHWPVHRLAPGADFALVHVVELPRAPSWHRGNGTRSRRCAGWVSRVAAEALDAAPCTCEAVCGSPAEEILAAAERYGADIIVMGTTGAGGARRGLLGRVVTQVLREARCAVLVVPTGTDVETS